MGERKRRLIYWIVRGDMHPLRMQRKFGMTTDQLDQFKKNNGKEITYRILSRKNT